jgi:hypothetical protein
MWTRGVANLRILDYFFVWLAISSAPCLLERISREPVVIESASQFSQEDADHLLRPEIGRIAGQFVSPAAPGKPARWQLAGTNRFLNEHSANYRQSAMTMLEPVP